MIRTYTFQGKYPGKHLLILGAIHGNEVCGTQAIEKLISQLESGEIVIENGSLTLVPVANEAAYLQGTRQVTINLNRIIRKHKPPQSIEEVYANQVCDLIDACDYLLDIHSMKANGIPFVCQDFQDKKRAAFASSMPVESSVDGWELARQLDSFSDTTLYAYQQNKTGVLVECGSHIDPHAKDIAYECILAAMEHCELIPANSHHITHKILTVSETIFKKKSGQLSQNWKHLDYLPQGTLFAQYDDGEQIIISQDSYLILPNSAAKVGDEWTYLAYIK